MRLHWPKNRRASYQTQRQTQGPATLAAMPVLRLALPTPLRAEFDYLPPTTLSPEALTTLQPGIRVQVPFGARQMTGVLLQVADETMVQADKLKAVTQIIDTEPLIDRRIMELCRWAAAYYKAPLGEVLAASLPKAMRQGQPFTPRSERYWALSTDGLGLPQGALKRAPKQADLLALLQNANKRQLPDQVLKAEDPAGSARRALQKKGLIEPIESAPVVAEPSWQTGPPLNEEQARAVETITASIEKFAGFLLQGVTGSGKTEVYLTLTERVLKSGRQALVLVPEIGLTPQTVQRFQQRFDANIAVMHSGLADGERLQAWEDARSGYAHIVIGTRSAIFTAMARPGLIIVDEEHDLSFKQQDGVRYSARDLAVKRAQLEKIPVLLGSATPSLESIANADSGRYQRLELAQRATGAAIPDFLIQDIRRAPLEAGMSANLLAAMQAELEANNQVLLFLNRRGYAPTLQCHDCGHVEHCHQCDARMTVHLKDAQLRCHHCGAQRRLPRECPTCQSTAISSRGLGTEQIESRLQQLYPEVPVHRVDRDTMQRKNAMTDLIEAVAGGSRCILLGTQMLTKGHHFPDVTLVGLLDADNSLFSSDFRGPERMGQLLVQVSGRAGRASKAGRVILQTHYPDHPLLQTLVGEGYAAYAAQLLQERKSRGLPPYGHLLMLRAEAQDMASAENCLLGIRQQCENGIPGQVTLVGPMPAAMQRRSGRYRAQLLALCTSRRAAQKAADLLSNSAENDKTAKRLRWSLDIDPLDTL